MNIFLITTTIYDSSIVFCDNNFLGLAKHVNSSCLKRETTLFCNNCSTCKDSNIFHNSLTTITKARSFHSSNFDSTTNLIYYKSCEGFAINILSNYKQRLTITSNWLKNWHKIFHCRNFLVCNKNVRIFKNCLHFIRISHKICRNITSVKLHTFNNLHLCSCTFSLFYSDNTIIFNFLHCFGNQLADIAIIIS